MHFPPWDVCLAMGFQSWTRIFPSCSIVALLLTCFFSHEFVLCGLILHVPNWGQIFWPSAAQSAFPLVLSHSCLPHLRWSEVLSPFPFFFSCRIIEPLTSRCTKFRFKPLTVGILQTRLKDICGKESVNASDEVRHCRRYTLWSCSCTPTVVEWELHVFCYPALSHTNFQHCCRWVHAQLDFSVCVLISCVLSACRDHSWSLWDFPRVLCTSRC